MDDQADTGMSREGGDDPSNRSKEGRDRKGTPDAAFDQWLQRGLHAMYDNIANEPIPEELLRLIDQDRDEGREK
ncbi:hypothetical protein IAI61_12070 [Roseomonas sp. 573]|uniref:Anti-sigma factor NepR domain-containing protein n=2 Tax=Roseomonas haemaphysalidis TaxID=2768162 RepID=A0ABS3KQN6_9PROT|nr:hypothetical protein [Roseomonas haemaphysalidis]